MHTYVHTIRNRYTYKHSQTYTHIRAQMYSYIHNDTHIRTHNYKYTHIHIHKYTHVHLNKHTHTRTHTHTHLSQIKRIPLEIFCLLKTHYLNVQCPRWLKSTKIRIRNKVLTRHSMLNTWGKKLPSNKISNGIQVLRYTIAYNTRITVTHTQPYNHMIYANICTPIHTSCIA